MASFGEMLEELRQDRHLSQRELGDKIHVTPGTISNYENGVHLPDVEKLVDLADFFGVTVDYLLGRCRTNFSPERWDQLLLEGQTAGDVVSTIQKLSPERKQALGMILHDFQFAQKKDESIRK
jgi:transcriptional regulator with XRE-family HTH domain